MNARAPSFAILGSGPAGLMAASRLLELGHRPEIFERRTGFGRKLLVAGSSGLNVSHDLPDPEFAAHYRSPGQPDFFREGLKRFPPRAWIEFIHGLGHETFVGTSSRYFVREMKSSGLLKSWTEDLRARGAILHAAHEWSGLARNPDGTWRLSFATPVGPVERDFDGVGFFLGGGSWEDSPPSWIAKFRALGIPFSEFAPANVGYEIDWPEALKREIGRAPLKNVVLRNHRGEKAGELMITDYGIEGTPVYFLGDAGPAYLDLKPAWSHEEIAAKMRAVKENLSPIRRAKKTLALSDEAQALLFHLACATEKSTVESLAVAIKALRIELIRPRPLAEAISSSGGVRMEALGPNLALRSHPGVFFGGEMLDWDAPTGGFLIQGSVLQGRIAAESMDEFARRRPCGST